MSLRMKNKWQNIEDVNTKDKPFKTPFITFNTEVLSVADIYEFITNIICYFYCTG